MLTRLNGIVQYSHILSDALIVLFVNKELIPTEHQINYFCENKKNVLF